MTYLLVILALRITYAYELPGWTTLIFAVIGFGGAQLAGLGLVGEYVGRIYDEVRQRPQYIIAEMDDNAAENEA